jgi:hypothetical protein
LALISVARFDASSVQCALRSETVIADLPFESRVDRISVFLLGCLKVAPGTTPDLGCKQSAFGFHHEKAKRFGTKRKGSLCANFFTNSRLIPFMRIIPIYAAVLGQDHHDRGIPLHCLSGALHGLDSGHGVKLPAIAISDGKQHIGMTRSAGFTQQTKSLRLSFR